MALTLSELIVVVSLAVATTLLLFLIGELVFDLRAWWRHRP